MKRNVLCISIGLILGQAATLNDVRATTLTFSLDGMFTLQGTYGSPLANSSINPKSANNYQTPITGTLTYDPDSGAGTMTIAPFDWGGVPSFTLFDITLQNIRSVPNIPDSLMLANMVYDWNSDTGIPASIVWDASGMLDAIDQGLNIGEVVAGTGQAPASDGTYVPYGIDGAYLNLGPAPIATTNWNTTNAPGCILFDCTGMNPSGLLPLVTDATWNENKSMLSGTDVYGVSGSPLIEGGYNQKNLNLDFTYMTLTAIDTNATIDTFDIATVPIPAAAWLFGSGLIGLAGTVRRGARPAHAVRINT
jgi:hypothetical protein